MEKKKYTKYEKARIIGSRALQISQGAPFLVKVSESLLEQIKYNPIEIAKLEYEADVIPIDIKTSTPKSRLNEAKMIVPKPLTADLDKVEGKD